jgi:hypothetical protein
MKFGRYQFHLFASCISEGTKVKRMIVVLINTAEVIIGEPLGKPRVKVSDKNELLHLGGLYIL